MPETREALAAAKSTCSTLAGEINLVRMNVEKVLKIACEHDTCTHTLLLACFGAMQNCIVVGNGIASIAFPVCVQFESGIVCQRGTSDYPESVAFDCHR